ncbi:MAG: hypothetical protein NTV25_10855 [Methanothrix sp.]|nr:hypothetical protein [Methanothrix sp.]
MEQRSRASPTCAPVSEGSLLMAHPAPLSRPDLGGHEDEAAARPRTQAQDYTTRRQSDLLTTPPH